MSAKLRLFTVEEANRRLPGVGVTLAKARALALKLGVVQEGIDAIVAREGEERVDRQENPDRGRYWRLVAELREGQQRIEAQIEEIRFLGAEVKDLRQGLVDFYSERDGELVYLCWKLGEPEIGFWHPLEGGFAARRPLSEGGPGSAQDRDVSTTRP